MSQTSEPGSRSSRPGPHWIARFVATGLYSGYAPFASGTAGSLVGLALYAIPGMENPLVLGCAILAAAAAGIPAAAAMERRLGEDPHVVVIDEIAGMWVSLLFLPRTPLAAAGAFFAFRLFDIVKPPPARRAERLPNGWGIMADDIVAGVYANILVRLGLLLLQAAA